MSDNQLYPGNMQISENFNAIDFFMTNGPYVYKYWSIKSLKKYKGKHVKYYIHFN
jgi:hypothetical protein